MPLHVWGLGTEITKAGDFDTHTDKLYFYYWTVIMWNTHKNTFRKLKFGSALGQWLFVHYMRFEVLATINSKDYSLLRCDAV
jgi:hypothetical protein